MRNLFLMAIIAVSVQAQAFTFSFAKISSKNNARFDNKKLQCVRVLKKYRPVTKVGVLVGEKAETTDCTSTAFRVIAHNYGLRVIKISKRAISKADFRAIEEGYIIQLAKKKNSKK